MTANLHSAKDWLLTWLRSITFPLGIVILVTSLVDLFITRILFRAGPDALTGFGIDLNTALYFSIVGRIAVTLEQFLVFTFIIVMAVLFLGESQVTSRVMGLSLAMIFACSAALYFPLVMEEAWAVSALLVLMTAALVPVLAYQYLSTHRGQSRGLRLTLIAFLASLTLGFAFPLYYRMYLLLGAAGVASLPFPLEAYLFGVFAVIATTLAAFAYSIQVPSAGFGLGVRNIVKVTAMPTLLVAPMLYEFLQSFFAVQIFALVLTMSTDIAVSHDVIMAIVVAFWFLFTAMLLLLLKGRRSADRMLVQQGMGLAMLMSTTMLFNYPYYIMLGITGVVFICRPLVGTSPETLLLDPA